MDIIIGKDRFEAIDWIQERLAVARPLAESTYMALEARGVIDEGQDDVVANATLTETILREAAAEEDVIRRNNKTRAHISRRHNPPRKMRGNYTRLHMGNTIDCATDEIYQ